MARRPQLNKKPRNRRSGDPAVQMDHGNISVSSQGPSTPTSTALITFGGNVLVTGRSSNSVYSGGTFTLSLIAPGVVKLTGPTAVASSAATLTIGNQDPAIRTSGGGFVTPKVITF